jgi:uncharacterized protein YigA (DUF484 family)
MSTQPKQQYNRELTSDEAVHDYLAENPDFFEKHNDLLRSLRLPHVTGGTVSLVERQVSALRQRDTKLEKRLNELVGVARTNDVLALKIHNLSLRLLGAASFAETIAICENALRSDFDADQSVLVLFSQPADIGEVESDRFLRPVDRDAADMRPFDAILNRTSPRCGQVRDSQRDFLFGEDTNEIGSVALVPLGPECRIGFLAIGSADAGRFHPGISIDFIERLGELIAAAIGRY